LIAILALLLIAIALFIIRRGKKREKLTPLASIAFFFILASFLFDERLIAYSLLGIAVVLAVIDMIIKLRKK
jgi:hypothetical protein